MPGSGPYIIQPVAPGSGISDPDAALRTSPLWPLQSAMRAAFDSAANNIQTTGAQIARLTATESDVEARFATFPRFDSATKLRDSIRALLDPNLGLDFGDDSLLSSLQAQILALPAWNDVLPT